VGVFSGRIIMALGSLLPLLLTFSGVHVVMLLLVGLGQAHFIHCYIYQYRAKKMDVDFFFKLLFGLLGAGIACLYLGDDVMIPAILIFILHQFFDDLYLYKRSANVWDYAQLSLVLMACFSLSTFGLEAWGKQLAAVLMAIGIVIGLLAEQRSTLITLSLPFGIPLYYVLMDYQAKDWLIPAGIIIVSHYLRWLVYVYQTRVQGQKWVFLTEALILNSICLLYAIATVFGGHSDYLTMLLQGLFSTQAFVIWTMAHIASTVRPRWIGR
jgi:uncharacterized membrane protein